MYCKTSKNCYNIFSVALLFFGFTTKKGGMLMDGLTFLWSVLASIVANAITRLIWKWLDGP